MTLSIVRELDDAQAIRAFLQRDRLWGAYGMCDLELPLRAVTRFWGSHQDGELVALLMAFSPPGFTVLMSYGDRHEVGTIVREIPDLPGSAELVVPSDHLDAFRPRYAFNTQRRAIRMAVTPETVADIQPAQPVDRLWAADWPDVQKLMDRETASVFGSTMPRDGVYYGARDGAMLVAVAGTHAISHRESIAAVGGVYTRPDYRGRGLATATTYAVTRALARAGIRDIVLNVRADNLPAVCAYTRIGFRQHVEYLEATATQMPGN